jgi:hypothetical protein
MFWKYGAGISSLWPLLISDQVNSCQNNKDTSVFFLHHASTFIPPPLFCLVLGTLKREGRWPRKTFTVLSETLNDFELGQSTHFCKTILNCDSSIVGSGVH